MDVAVGSIKSIYLVLSAINAVFPVAATTNSPGFTGIDRACMLAGMRYSSIDNPSHALRNIASTPVKYQSEHGIPAVPPSGNSLLLTKMPSFACKDTASTPTGSGGEY